MTRIEIKPNRTSEQCACRGHSAKYRILVKGMYSTPQMEIPLCEDCFEELKEKLTPQEIIDDEEDTE